MQLYVDGVQWECYLSSVMIFFEIAVNCCTYLEFRSHTMGALGRLKLFFLIRFLIDVFPLCETIKFSSIAVQFI